MTESYVFKGAIRTCDPARPVVRAMAVAGGEVAAVGNDAEGLLRAYPGAALVEVPEGQAVLPGFGDVHVHMLMAGHREAFELAIELSWDVEKLLASVRDYAATVPEGRWVEGGYWNIARYAELNSPAMRARFDAACGGKPMLLRDDTAHNRLVNSAALRLMGIDPDHAGGHGPEVLVDADGVATGMLVESAARWAEETLVANSAELPGETRDSLAKAVQMMNSRGVTMLQECASGLPMLDGFKELDDAGALDAWVVTSVSLNDLIFGFTPIGQPLVEASGFYKGKRLLPTFAKMFGDGTPPTHTAFWHDAYLPTEEFGADYHGRPNLSFDKMRRWFCTLAEHGMGCVIHCAGDATISMVVDAAQALADKGVRLPLHTAHAQYIARDDWPRMADLGIVVDISPQFWFPSDFHYSAMTTMPPHIGENICLFRDLLEAGVPMAGGSDWPCSPDPNPWFGIHGLVTRQNPHGDFPGVAYRPDQALTLDEAIAMYTTSVAAAMGIADRTGSLTPGNAADFIVCDDPYLVDPLSLKDVRTLQTWVAGRQVFALE